jgi:hypothetical protein
VTGQDLNILNQNANVERRKIMEENKTQEIQQAFSQVAAEFAAETDKKATETPEELKAHNLPEDQQMEFNSKFFKMYNTQFQNMIKGMNKKALMRVIGRLIAYPLETPSELKWNSKQEHDTFLIGNQLLEVKYLMFKYILSEQIAKETLEKLNNEKKEEVNG